jgi:hypothetical protein
MVPPWDQGWSLRNIISQNDQRKMTPSGWRKDGQRFAWNPTKILEIKVDSEVWCLESKRGQVRWAGQWQLCPQGMSGPMPESCPSLWGELVMKTKSQVGQGHRHRNRGEGKRRRWKDSLKTVDGMAEWREDEMFPCFRHNSYTFTWFTFPPSWEFCEVKCIYCHCTFEETEAQRVQTDHWSSYSSQLQS